MQNENAVCTCGSTIRSGFSFCPACGADVGTTIDANFESADAPTRVSEPDFVLEQRERGAVPSAQSEERVRVERVKGARPPVRMQRTIPPWVPVADRRVEEKLAALSAPPAVEARAASGGGFGKGLAIGFGVAGTLFGMAAVAFAGVAVATHGFSQPLWTSSPAIARVAIPAATPVVVERPVVAIAEPSATPVALAPAPEIVATPAPVKIVATPTPVKIAERVATPAPVKPVIAARATPAPAPVRAATTRTVYSTSVVATLATPTPAPVVAARPSRDELLSLATSARRAASTPTPVAVAATPASTPAPAFFVAPAPAATATPAPVAAASSSFFSAPSAPAAKPAPTLAPFNPGADVEATPAAASATPATTDSELDDILGSPEPKKSGATSMAPKKAPAKDSAERVIHSRSGDKPVVINGNIALTKADGKTVVGTLVAVGGGFIDVKTSDAKLRIPETAVLDAATY